MYSAGICLALVWVLGGTMNSVLLTMPAVVYTAGLATAMHLINYYRDGRIAEDCDGPLTRALPRPGCPARFRPARPSLGLISLYISELVPIRNFGFYHGVGRDGDGRVHVSVLAVGLAALAAAASSARPTIEASLLSTRASSADARWPAPAWWRTRWVWAAFLG